MEKIDLIFIDGRFRVASLINCYNRISMDCIILFDDFKYRENYHDIIKYFKVIDYSDKLFALKRNLK